MTEQLNQENQNTVKTKFKGTVYAKLPVWTTVLSDVKKIFKPISKGWRCALETEKEASIGENYMELQLIDDTIISFSVLHDNKKVNEHFSKLATFVTNMRFGTNEEKEKMVLEILNFNYMLGIEFEINSDNSRSEFIMTLVLNIAEKLNGYLFMTQKGISTFLDGKGNKIFPNT